MKKTYWWRGVIMLFATVVFVYGYIAVNKDELGLYNSYIDPSMFLSLSLLLVSPFLFFIRDAVFLKWLRFAGVWFFLSALFVALSPEYQRGWMGIGPTKELVSLWMGVLFVIASIAKIVWDSRRR